MMWKDIELIQTTLSRQVVEVKVELVLLNKKMALVIANLDEAMWIRTNCLCSSVLIKEKDHLPVLNILKHLLYTNDSHYAKMWIGEIPRNIRMDYELSKILKNEGANFASIKCATLNTCSNYRKSLVGFGMIGKRMTYILIHIMI